MNSDASCINYSSLCSNFGTNASGVNSFARLYIPGYNGNISAPSGPAVVNFYSAAKFSPPTRARWEPAVGTTTNGRVYIGFSDNPELQVQWQGIADVAVRTAFVKGLGSVISFPVWQETDIAVPMNTRRKMFDVNGTVDLTDVNAVSRSMQTCLYMAVEGAPASMASLGSLWVHDCVMVEGLTFANT